MGIGNIGIPGLILILVVALIIFGPSKLPEIGRAFGKSLKEFKNATQGLTSDDEQKKDQKQTITESKTAEGEKKD
ncbi:twin-arginine translocase TatA/TatE family subunit [Sporolactobacillus putidus]|uniref:Sec-independent protein translocase protein TatA n=1 Tax=Sporolactobacillus putidus TaxID=492735 RepID=A0A917S3D5_9BACL|nr:twin-arginine translocase TatA/TatE family subunit [Sporolactobacillus putidus]GGL54095.1 hypothetical protein GCM10007968_17620 [Sporolactobacillus putidus]